MQKDHKIYLEHILISIEKIEIILQDVPTKDGFLEDENMVYREAIFRQLEIIGEAVKKLPNSFKEKYNEVPWKQISGMRDYLIHEYFSINYERVWETIITDMPKLKDYILKIL